jgi:hypothetical protein
MKENFIDSPQYFGSNWVFMTSDTLYQVSDTKQPEPQVRLGYNLAGGNKERI